MIETLRELHAKYRGLNEGKVASYIPELSKADPADFAIAVATVDGQIHSVGDDRKLFTMQSVAKPFVHALALQERGRDFVLSRVGVEPTGDSFNHIKLDERSKRPYNPMVNAGAIAMASLIRGATQADRLNRMLGYFEILLGRRAMIDASVFTSERQTGHRNRAMAHLMLNFGMIDGDVDDHLDLYFQECSMLADCRELAVMAATLANGGVQPVTGKPAVASEYIKDVLSVMYTCGMYDFAGEWAYTVGMPAKSGVGGGLIAVAPGKLGIAVYSPALDFRGNSVRGIKVCEDLARHLKLHVFDR